MGNLMKNWLKKITGLARLEEEKARLNLEKEVAEEQTRKAKEAEELAKMNPKERATARGEPWIAVLDTKVNADNPRNGFFELDWNELFIVQLKKAGYGYDGDPDEEIVDRWFRDLYSNMLHGEGMEAKDRTAGFVNVTRLGGGKAEVE
jgi:hypothetical protein